MAKSSPPPVERAFTLIELLVVIAIIGILAGIAIPSLNRAFERAKVTKDMSNLRQIGTAMQMYLNDKNGVLAWYQERPGMDDCSPVIYPKYLVHVARFPIAF